MNDRARAIDWWAGAVNSAAQLGCLDLMTDHLASMYLALCRDGDADEVIDALRRKAGDAAAEQILGRVTLWGLQDEEDG
jgi:hypothetical protein